MYLKYLNSAIREGEEEGNSTLNIVIKILSIVVFLLMALGFGVMPYFIVKCRTSTKFLSISNAFAGGLFLGIGLFHVLPESNEMLSKSIKDVPLAFFCAFLSYALILFVEKVIFNSHSLLHGHDHSKREEEYNRITLSKLNQSERETKEKENEDENKNENDEEKESKEPMVKVEFKPKEQKENKNGDDKTDENEHIGEDDDDHDHAILGSSLTPYILLLALGFHGLFEGMALGIVDNVQSTLTLCLAIAAHKWAASLTLGISFVKAGVKRNKLISMVAIFALIGPVGIAIGLILSTEANEFIQGIFLAISVGTFIYIACTEVLVEEFENPDHKYLKFLMFMLGGIFIGGLSILEMVLGVEEEEEKNF